MKCLFRIIKYNVLFNLFFLYNFIPTHSQKTDISYLQNWSSWMVVNNSTNDGASDRLFCIAFDDSIIDGEKYVKINIGDYGSLSLLYEIEDSILCYRQVEKKIYRYDNKTKSDIQMCEFGLTKGDYTTNGDGINLVVDSVFPANTLSQYSDFPTDLMAYSLHGVDNTEYSDIWIDHVGSIKTGILRDSDFPINSTSGLIYCIRRGDGAIYFDYDTDEEKMLPFEATDYSWDDLLVDEYRYGHYELEFIDDTLHVFGRVWIYENNINIMDCIINENKVNIEIIPVYKMGGVDNPGRYWFDAKIPGFNTGTYNISYVMSYIYDNEYLQKDTTLVCHGPATGIQDINKPQTLENKVDIYDLSGRRLNTIPKRGIFIQDGKKVVK